MLSVSLLDQVYRLNGDENAVFLYVFPYYGLLGMSWEPFGAFVKFLVSFWGAFGILLEGFRVSLQAARHKQCSVFACFHSWGLFGVSEVSFSIIWNACGCLLESIWGLWGSLWAVFWVQEGSFKGFWVSFGGLYESM